MSIFGSIMSKIFGGEAKAAPSATPPSSSVPPAAAPKPAPGTTAPAATAAAPSAPRSAGQAVDVDAVLAQKAAHGKQELDWRHSIVDLMKLLDLDSSLAARKELAKELNYTGSTDDTAAMNMWLHRQVMVKLAENGGKVPEDLRV